MAQKCVITYSINGYLDCFKWLLHAVLKEKRNLINMSIPSIASLKLLEIKWFNVHLI